MAGQALYSQAESSQQEPGNEVHGFVITENEEPVEDMFNITLCQEVKWRNEVEDGWNWYPSGHIFGKLHGIYRDDDPEPAITISQQDFDEYREDTVNLSIYILGKYMRDDPHGEDEPRKAYKKIIVQRPNNAPNAVATITECDENEKPNWDNWTTIDSNDRDEVVYYIDDEGVSVKFYLNASESWDEDGDNVTEWMWDLDEDGRFGMESRERKMNTTVYLGEGDHTLSLMVGDGIEFSDPLYIHILIRQPVRRPDLMIQDIQVVNRNGEADIKKDDRCIVRPLVKNIGDDKTNDPFDVFFEYWPRDEYPDPNWLELGSVSCTQDVEVNQLKLIEIDWDTGFADFLPGNYSFRVTADYDEEIWELREMNNVFPSSDKEKSAEIILVQDNEGGDEVPDLSIQNVEVSKSEVLINEVVFINITLLNEGDGIAKYVDIYYYIDNMFWYYRTIDLIETDSLSTVSFVFAGDTDNSFKLKFEVKDNGAVVETSNVYTIKVFEGSIPQVFPILTISDPQNNAEAIGKISITGIAYHRDHNLQEVEYRFAGNDTWLLVNGTSTWDLELDTSKLVNGNHTLEFRAYNGISYSEIKTLTINVNNKKGSSDSSSITSAMYAGAIGVVAVIVLVAFVVMRKKKAVPDGTNPQYQNLPSSNATLSNPSGSTGSTTGSHSPPPPPQGQISPNQFPQGPYSSNQVPAGQVPQNQVQSFNQSQESQMYPNYQQPQQPMQQFPQQQQHQPMQQAAGVSWTCPVCGNIGGNADKFCMYCGSQRGQ